LGTKKRISQIRSDARAAGIVKPRLNAACWLLGVKRHDSGHTWMRIPRDVEEVREWVERELPVGTERPADELRTVVRWVDESTLRQALGELGIERIAGPDGREVLRRPEAAAAT
jgi:hypothetical protein